MSAGRAPWIAVGAAQAVALGCLVWVAAADEHLRDEGRADLVQLADPGTLSLVVGAAACCAVGGALAVRRTRHPVGWLLLALGESVFLGGAAAAWGLLASLGPDRRAGAHAALVADQVPVLWHVLVTLVLLVTPTGRVRGRPARILAGASVISGLALSGSLSLSGAPLDPPFTLVQSPFAWPAVADAVSVVRGVSLAVLLLALLGAGVELLVRARRAASAERRQLRWLLLAVPPAVALILAAATASAFGSERVLGILAGAFLGLLPTGIGVAVVRDQLYDLERLLNTTTTYLLLTASVVLLYATTVLTSGLVLGEAAGNSQAIAVLATVLAVSITWPLRGRLQKGLDRRFARRRYAARALVRAHAVQPRADRGIEQVLRQATGDPELQLCFPVDDGTRWVREDGHPAHVIGDLRIEHRGSAVAAVAWQAPAQEGVVRAALDEARGELESARLRAEVAVRLVEVRASRARIVQAQLAERRRFERDLHDGVQQRLLALAMRLAHARRHGTAQAVLDPALAEIQLVLDELRGIANGLHPALLVDGGLSAALDDLAVRVPLPVRLTTPVGRFAPEVEAAAWFIACEAVANAVKHAGAAGLEIRAEVCGPILRLAVHDDGRGGAEAGGTGLRGIADRAAAVGGRLWVDEAPQGGTIVRAELPCGS